MNERADNWFAVDAPRDPDGSRHLAAMSHNGSARTRGQDGTSSAFRKAYDAGWRWFQVDALPTKAGLISRHAWNGRNRRYGRMDKEQLAKELPDVPLLADLLETYPDVRWNI